MDKLWIALLITSVLLIGVPGAVWAQATEGIEIKAISITGLNRLSDEKVITGLTIKVGDRIVGNLSTKLNQAEEALFNTGWFRETPQLSLDTDGQDSGAILKVEVVENKLYSHTVVAGNTLKSTELIIEQVEGTPDESGSRMGAHLVAGQVINYREIAAAMDEIRELYADSGYIAAMVADWRVLEVDDDFDYLSLRMSEGFCDSIIISGLSETRESVVRSQITHIRPDRIIEQRDLMLDMQAVYNTGLFNTVNPRIETSLKEGYLHVVFEVEEATTGQAGVGLGYSTINGLQGTLSYNEKNLFGSGKELGATLIFSENKPGYRLSFSDPYFTDDSFWSVGLFDLHNKQQRYPGTAYESELSIDSQGVSLNYGQHINDEDSWVISTGITDYDYRILKGDPFRGYTVKERARLSAQGQTRKVGATLSHDTRDNRFESSTGFLAQATMEVAGFGGDFNFNKLTLEGREFFKLGPGVLAMRQKYGIGSGDVPIYEEYTLGGVSSIRGVSEDLLSGTHMFLTNFEYRYRFNDMFGGVLFVDSGWSGESFSDMSGATGAGVGARIKVKAIGSTVRLDYGWELDGDPNSTHRFHFFLGEMF